MTKPVRDNGAAPNMCFPQFYSNIQVARRLRCPIGVAAKDPCAVDNLVLACPRGNEFAVVRDGTHSPNVVLSGAREDDDETR